MAGQVRARASPAHTGPDFMAMEKDRRHLCPRRRHVVRLLNKARLRFKPCGHAGHSDFSENTYRTLTGGGRSRDGNRRRRKAVESRRKKLFESARTARPVRS